MYLSAIYRVLTSSCLQSIFESILDDFNYDYNDSGESNEYDAGTESHEFEIYGDCKSCHVNVQIVPPQSSPPIEVITTTRAVVQPQIQARISTTAGYQEQTETTGIPVSQEATTTASTTATNGVESTTMAASTEAPKT